MSMDYEAYTKDLSNKLQQAVLAGRHADLCPESEAFDDTAMAVSEILRENGLAVSREVFFCKVGKGGRIEASIIVQGVTDEPFVNALDEKLCDKTMESDYMDDIGEAEIQVFLSPDTDWPERLYASGRPALDGTQWASLLRSLHKNI